MSPSDHKRIFRHLIEEGFNHGRLAVLDAVLTSDFADHSPCAGGGADALRERIVLLRLAMPDLHACVDELAAAGDMIWATITIRGTVRGDPGMAVADCLGFRRIETCRFENGQIAEYWSESADVIEQLGISVT
jgi:predicted SnoaL-like aldol condensation-catalyzing enzyme